MNITELETLYSKLRRSAINEFEAWFGKVVKDARDEGYSEGYEDGFTDGKYNS